MDATIYLTIYLSTEKHMGHFKLLAVTHKATRNIHTDTVV